MSDCVYIGLDSADVGKQKNNTHTGLYDLVSEPRVQTCRHLVKTSMTALLHRQFTCANCHRSEDSPSHGAAINSRGCTGACLQWAREIMEHPHRFRYEPTWPDWPDIVARFRIVCSNINELGCGYFSGGVGVGPLTSDTNMIGSNGHVNVIVNPKSIQTLKSIKLGGLPRAESSTTL